jgi:triosephosphate isomerase (TIM)
MTPRCSLVPAFNLSFGFLIPFEDFMVQRSVVITGNWKMYKTIEEAVSFVKELTPLIANSHAAVFLAVPYTAIKPVSDAAHETKIVIGAQNMNDASQGAFTGEIAGRMLKDAGAQFVILGHSERRKLFHETDEFVNKKVKRALKDGLKMTVCIGETKEEREEGKTEEVLKTQLSQSLADVSAEQMHEIMIAYEPIWAIGTDLSATPESAQTVHAYLRTLLLQLWNEDVAQETVIQYGGSVKPDNASALLDQMDIDGLLVGGASLSVTTFSQIVNSESVKFK